MLLEEENLDLYHSHDPDGDRVRCRWAEPSECGGGCTNLPINSVRLDPLTLRIINSACDAIGQLQFLSPSPKHNSVYSYSTAQYQHKVPVEVSFYIQDILGRKPDFMLSGPENITYTYENDDTKRTNVTKFRIVWHVDATKQQGSRQLTTAPRYEDGCKNKTCLNNGNCLNVFGSNETCRCTPKYSRSRSNKYNKNADENPYNDNSSSSS
ncbi:hypothetical protein DPMN_097198 [Dreissena polymorpha]|uniref:EGF-like domain-containing protein n=1 Tax=Dreissena polymorpha TaxID=45954 RepID=A0A9D4LCI8_DREPO|nr:hypothetical protein DPMN_097198 [Dreissena polymorpha]